MSLKHKFAIDGYSFFLYSFSPDFTFALRSSNSRLSRYSFDPQTKTAFRLYLYFYNQQKLLNPYVELVLLQTPSLSTHNGFGLFYLLFLPHFVTSNSSSSGIMITSACQNFKVFTAWA